MDLIIGQKPGQPPRSASRQPAPPPPPPQRLQGSVSDAPGAENALISDGDQSTFMRDVIEASRQLPIIVDFWATWCGPCKQLTPTLEKVVRAAGGRVRLVKIDIDKNRALVQQLAQLGLPMQSVPTVAAFYQGQIADIFSGAQPESEVKRFVESLLKIAGGAMPSAELAAEAKAALEDSRPDEAAELYSALLEAEPENPEGWGGLIRALMALGDEEQAQDVLSRVPAAIASHAEIVGARSALALAAEGRAASSQLSVFQQRLAANAADHEARYELATALNAMGRRDEAADALLKIVRHARDWNDDAGRMQLLKFFEAWGFDDAATLAARRKLSALLFS